jgi:hypothetical protein
MPIPLLGLETLSADIAEGFHLAVSRSALNLAFFGLKAQNGSGLIKPSLGLPEAKPRELAQQTGVADRVGFQPHDRPSSNRLPMALTYRPA